MLPVIGSAQTIKLGGGVSMITQPANSSDAPHLVLSPVGSIAADWMINKHISIGGSVAITQFARKSINQRVDINANPLPDQIVKSYYGSPAIIINPRASYHTGDLYFGAQLGLVVAGSKSYYESGNNVKIYSSSYTGFSAGLHAGYNKTIVKKIGAFVELSGNYIATGLKTAGSSVSFMQPQGIAGLSYKI